MEAHVNGAGLSAADDHHLSSFATVHHFKDHDTGLKVTAKLSADSDTVPWQAAGFSRYTVSAGGAAPARAMPAGRTPFSSGGGRMVTPSTGGGGCGRMMTPSNPGGIGGGGGRVTISSAGRSVPDIMHCSDWVVDSCDGGHVGCSGALAAPIPGMRSVSQPGGLAVARSRAMYYSAPGAVTVQGSGGVKVASMNGIPEACEQLSEGLGFGEGCTGMDDLDLAAAGTTDVLPVSPDMLMLSESGWIRPGCNTSTGGSHAAATMRLVMSAPGTRAATMSEPGFSNAWNSHMPSSRSISAYGVTSCAAEPARRMMSSYGGGGLGTAGDGYRPTSTGARVRVGTAVLPPGAIGFKGSGVWAAMQGGLSYTRCHKLLFAHNRLTPHMTANIDINVDNTMCS